MIHQRRPSAITLAALAFALSLPLVAPPEAAAAEVSDAMLREILQEQKATRAMARELKDQNTALEKRIAAQDKEIAALKKAAGTPAKKEAAAEKKEVAAEKKPGPASEDHALDAHGKLQEDETKYFSTPDSPAAAVLGIAPEKVIHASTPKQLIMSAVNGLDDKGHFQTGFAVDFAPAQLFPAVLEENNVVHSYRETGGRSTFSWQDYAVAVVRRTQFSFAAIRGTEAEDQSSKLAFGVNVTLMDAEDHLVSGRFQYPRPLRGEHLAAYAGPEALNPEMRIETPFRNEGFGRLMNLLYRHASWSVGGAATWLSLDPEEEDYEYAGATLWSTFTMSFAKPRWMAGPTAADGKTTVAAEGEGNLHLKAPYRLLLHTRYDDQQSIPGGDAVNPPVAGIDPVTGATLPAPAFVDQDSLLAVGAFRMGRKDFNVTASAAYVKRWQRSGGSGMRIR